VNCSSTVVSMLLCYHFTPIFIPLRITAPFSTTVLKNNKQSVGTEMFVIFSSHLRTISVKFASETLYFQRKHFACLCGVLMKIRSSGGWPLNVTSTYIALNVLDSRWAPWTDGWHFLMIPIVPRFCWHGF